MVLIVEEPGYPGDFGKVFDSDECLQAARSLYEAGSTVTPPGVVSTRRSLSRTAPGLWQAWKGARGCRVVPDYRASGLLLPART